LLAEPVSSDQVCGRQLVAGHLFRSIVLLISQTYKIVYKIHQLKLAAGYSDRCHAVRQQTQEIGVRMAFGATPWHILNNVALLGLRPVAAGMIIGIACGKGDFGFIA
jgi:hypothetical protein